MAKKGSFADAAITLRRNRRGAVSIIGAFALVGVIGFAALAVDINRGYDQRVTNQRVADMAALAAALAYRNNAQTGVLQPTAEDMATANGITGATVTAELVDNVPTAGSKAVKVRIVKPVPIAIGAALGLRGSYDVAATAYAAVSTVSIAPPCFLSLAASGVGVSTSGGATIDTPDCSVAAVSAIENNGTRIAAKNIISGSGSITNSWGTLTADQIRYAGSFTNPSWNGNIPSADKIVRIATPLADPLADNADLAAARTLLGTSVAPRTLADPVTPAGSDWIISWSPSANVQGFRQGSSGNFVIPAGNYTIGQLFIDGGLNVRFASGSRITVAKGIYVGGGSTVEFGDVDLKVNGGFNSGSGGIRFGNGSFAIGSGVVNLAGTNVFGDGDVTINAGVTISGGTTLRMGKGNHAFQSIYVGGGSWMTLGDGDLDVRAGISVAGSSTLAAGIGAYRLGRNGSGNAIELSGSAVMLMGDGSFSADGSITTAGGSRLVFGRTPNHLINGNLSIAGSVLFGTSRYTVAGNFTNGTGGTVWPYTSPVTGLTYGNMLEGVNVAGYDMAGVNVSFVLGGTVNLAGGARTLLIAPSTGVSGGAIADVLIDSQTSGATNWGAGAQNVFVGAVHLPNSDLTMSGGSTTLSAGQCFMLIANRITATGGAAAGSACKSITGGSAGGAGQQIRLVR